MRVLALILSLWSAATLAAPSSETPAVVRLAVPGMTCPVCPITVHKALTRLPGVIEARVDYDHKSAWVRYDPAKVSPAELMRATADAGYPSTLMAPDGQGGDHAR